MSAPSSKQAAPVQDTPKDGQMLNEDPVYLQQQLITYLGNKRALLSFIGEAVQIVRARLGRDKLSIFDAFSGSGVVSRYFKQYASHLHSNDLEPYCEVINRCYLANPGPAQLHELRHTHRALLAELSEERLQEGFITELYAPANDQQIQAGERAFYTRRNAKYLDSARSAIQRLSEEQRHWFLAPLLSEASIHANTAGVFKGFYKDSASGIGSFGGRKADALSRITGPIQLPFPLFSRFSTGVSVHRGDTNTIAKELPPVDLAYIDPPYNQHPYGSNYFMLNLLTNYQKPDSLSPVSGIPGDWQRSSYNKRKEAADSLRELIHSLKARYILVSFNSEGFISENQMLSILREAGDVQVLRTRYNTFRGSRNLSARATHLTEYLYLTQKKS